MNRPCGCCEGTQALTPLPVANRPGLNALAYRVGTHASFLETLKARLSSSDYPPLAGLKTRDPGDPAIAWLDAWATLADVLTFYQERIANEGYLRTATERRSILELARLVGYNLRPGVAASVYLAYTLDNNQAVEIPAGARAQSLPGPGELPQSFETSEPLQTRTDWNNLQPRLTRPQKIFPSTGSKALDKDTIYFEGTAINLQTGDPLLFVFGPNLQILCRVKTVEAQSAQNRTKVVLQEKPVSAARLADTGLLAETKASSTSGSEKDQSDNKTVQALDQLKKLVAPLCQPPSLQPANSRRLPRDINKAFASDSQSDTVPQVLTTLQPCIAAGLYSAWENAAATQPATVEVYALRQTAPLFGSTAPRKVIRINRDTGEVTTAEWPVIEDPYCYYYGTSGIGSHLLVGEGEQFRGEFAGRCRIKHEDPTVVWLDASYDKILPDSWIVVDTRAVDGTKFPLPIHLLDNTSRLVFAKAQNPNAALSRAEYGISGKTTRVELGSPADPSKSVTWLTPDIDDPAKVPPSPDDFQVIRQTVVYAQSEPLTLAEEPLTDSQGNGVDVQGNSIELDGLYDGLQSGRWTIVSGERTDLKGVKASELVMLAGVQQSHDPQLPGDKIHSTLFLANSLAYTYQRDTVTLYGNVVKATHGETRNEVLGSGDASQALQQFTLRQPPLTYISASTRDGVASTLQVRVNDVLWHEADSLVDAGPNDRRFITRTDDEDKTTVVFGNGRQGARLPTGTENIKAVYRNGIGKPGNVKEEQISLLATQPLGVKAVINPLPASGGADRESRDQARDNAPLPTMALDRLVSVQDYADFSRTFAGIGKASSARLSDGRRQLVYVTIAGADDIPIAPTSDLFQNLRQALLQYGDPHLPIQVAVRELLLLVISAGVRLQPDYQWESVEPQIRAALLDTFSFARRELGQSVFLSEAISTIQQVTGVAYVDVDVFDNVSAVESDFSNLVKTLARREFIQVELARRPAAATGIAPAQLAYLTPATPDTLVLKEIAS